MSKIDVNRLDVIGLAKAIGLSEEETLLKLGVDDFIQSITDLKTLSYATNPLGNKKYGTIIAFRKRWVKVATQKVADVTTLEELKEVWEHVPPEVSMQCVEKMESLANTFEEILPFLTINWEMRGEAQERILKNLVDKARTIEEHDALLSRRRSSRISSTHEGIERLMDEVDRARHQLLEEMLCGDSLTWVEFFKLLNKHIDTRFSKKTTKVIARSIKTFIAESLARADNTKLGNLHLIYELTRVFGWKLARTEVEQVHALYREKVLEEMKNTESTVFLLNDLEPFASNIQLSNELKQRAYEVAQTKEDWVLLYRHLNDYDKIRQDAFVKVASFYMKDEPVPA